MSLFGNRKEEIDTLSYQKDTQPHTEALEIEQFKPTVSPKETGALYLIDFENVHDEGLHGIESLTQADKAVIFYGSLNKMIALDTHFLILQSKAQIESLHLEKSAKNYLDFQLVTYLGYLLGTGSYTSVYIISKDSGFDSVVDFWKARAVAIERRPAIALPQKLQPAEAEARQQKAKAKQPEQKKPEAKQPEQKKPEAKKPELAQSTQQKKAQKPEAPKKDAPEAIRKKIRAALQNQKLAGSNYTTIYRAFAAAKDKNAYDTSLRKALGEEKGAQVYAATKLIWSEAHK